MIIPTAWSSDEITATFNSGTFNENDTVYLFVIDSDGVASDGYEITIGSIDASNQSTYSGNITITGDVILQ